MLIRYIFILLIFVGCSENKQFQEELFIPLILNLDTTKIEIDDYLLDKNVDSVTYQSDIIFNKEKRIVKVIPNDKISNLSVISFWTKNIKHDLLLKKNLKKKITISYPISSNIKKVQIASEFNNWNPNESNFKLEGDTWTYETFLNSGKYQYQIVINDKWEIDKTNSDSTSNGIGGYNSVLNINHNSKKKLSRITCKDINNEIFINKNNETNIIAFLDNQIIDSQNKIIIPKSESRNDYSTIRIFSFNKDQIGNSIIIPLKKGKIVYESKELNQNDKLLNVLYFMLVDRFSNGNKKNDFPVNDNDVHFKANYQGGDIEGIINKINSGYFNKLGINTIWLSPITQNPLHAEIEYPEPKRKYSGYHGYWPISCTQIDHRFGSSKDLENLVRLAHKNNLKVILDYVSNHVHDSNPLIINNPDWSTNLILEDGRENIRIWDEHRLTTWFDRFLPTIDYSNKDAIDVMTDSALYMLEKYNLDGFRHDATKHIPKLFWKTLTKKIKKKYPNKSIYQIGETFASRELIGSYVQTGQLDGQFDFNLYFDLRNVFAKDNSNFNDLHSSLMQSFEYYGDHSLMGNITGNHDIPRFISYASDALSFNEDEKEAGWTREVKILDTLGYNRLRMLTAFITTIPGIPIIYYGDEIGLVGAGDPDNRKKMIFKDLNNFQNKTKENLKKLLDLRNNRMSLIYGGFNLIDITSDLYIYERNYFEEKSIVIFNKSDEIKEITINNLEEYNINFNSRSDKNIVKIKPYNFEILTNKEK